ncbi:MAG: O-antigen ligase family protein [Candidatus Thiodiazotropha sp. (ex. Lucinoma kazani)]
MRSIYIISLIILILAIVGTQSRGASLALMGTFGYLWWMGRQKVMGLLLIGGVLLAVISFAPPVYFERMNTISNYENEGSAMGRIVAWKTAIRMVSAYPVTGVGAGHFTVKLGTEFRPPEFGDENFPWLTAHSSYFLILGELGIPGIVFFSCFAYRKLLEK